MTKIKMNRLFKATYKLIAGFRLLFLIFVIAFAILGAAAVLMPNEYFNLEMAKILPTKKGAFSIDFMNGIRYTLKEGDLSSMVNIRKLLVALIGAGFLYSFILQYIFMQLKELVKTTIEDHPFDRGNARRIFNMAFPMFGAGFLFPILKGFIYNNMIDIFGLENFNIVYSIDFFWIMTGLLLILLSYIFKYGAFLQTEYDETI